MRRAFCWDIAAGCNGCCEIDEIADNRVLTAANEILIMFDYPLRRPHLRPFVRTGGFTRRDFAEAVSRGYAEIYAEEARTSTTDPEPTGELLNRNETDGKHGIWGHDIGDLLLTAAELREGV